MVCAPDCVIPTAENAKRGGGPCHCGVCHQTFGGLRGFDLHRRKDGPGKCTRPYDLGMVLDRNFVWRRATPERFAAP